MPEFHSHDVPDLTLQYGEVRQTWHNEKVLCILEAVWWWAVRSRVIESRSPNAKIDDILSWTANRWSSFIYISEWEEVSQAEDLWVPEVEEPSTKRAVVLVPSILAIVEESLAQVPMEADANTWVKTEELPLPEEIEKRWWTPRHFVIMKDWMVRFSLVWTARFAWITVSEKAWIIEGLESAFKKSGLEFIFAWL